MVHAKWFNRLYVNLTMNRTYSEIYTREDNPAIYYEPVVELSNMELSSFEKLPRIFKTSTVDLSCNKFSSLIGSPKFIPDVSLVMDFSYNQNLKSMEGLDAECKLLNITDCHNLESLSGIPYGIESLNIQGNTKITSFEDCSASIVTCKFISCDSSGLTSLKHLPKTLSLIALDLYDCTSLNALDLDISVKCQTLYTNLGLNQSWAKLINLHSLLHDEKKFKEVIVCDEKEKYIIGRKVRLENLSIMLNNTPDPFEFQDWCINHSFGEFL